VLRGFFGGESQLRRYLPMSIVTDVYSRKELEGLDDEAREKLQKELKKQIAASREIRAIIYAHDELNKSLKEKLRDTFEKLKK
jgi:ABC-type Fe3+/spermidine/putrescine transport system ATPase subunit